MEASEWDADQLGRAKGGGWLSSMPTDVAAGDLCGAPVGRGASAVWPAPDCPSFFLPQLVNGLQALAQCMSCAPFTSMPYPSTSASTSPGGGIWGGRLSSLSSPGGDGCGGQGPILLSSPRVKPEGPGLGAGLHHGVLDMDSDPGAWSAFEGQMQPGSWAAQERGGGVAQGKGQGQQGQADGMSDEGLWQRLRGQSAEGLGAGLERVPVGVYGHFSIKDSSLLPTTRWGEPPTPLTPGGGTAEKGQAAVGRGRGGGVRSGGMSGVPPGGGRRAWGPQGVDEGGAVRLGLMALRGVAAALVALEGGQIRWGWKVGQEGGAGRGVSWGADFQR